jgi:hypothetical protein
MDGEMDGQADMMKLMVTFHNCANMPKTQLTWRVVIGKPIELEHSFHQFLAVVTGTEQAVRVTKLYMCHGMMPRILLFVLCSKQFYVRLDLNLPVYLYMYHPSLCE